MQAFDTYFRKKLQAIDFKALYEKECHVCAKTMAIIEKAAEQSLSMEQLAQEVDAPVEAIELLRDADYCDPHLTVRLCRHFGLPLPDKACPRRGTLSESEALQ